MESVLPRRAVGPDADVAAATSTTTARRRRLLGAGGSAIPARRTCSTAAVYTRGAMAVQALRHRIGEEAFWRCCGPGWPARDGNGSVADFEALAESVSGQDLDGFFDAWLATPVAAGEDGGERAGLARD